MAHSMFLLFLSRNDRELGHELALVSRGSNFQRYPIRALIAAHAHDLGT